MKSIKNLKLITLALLILNGCSGIFGNRQKGHFTSQVSLENTTLIPSITQDMVNFVKNYYSISKTTFYFKLDSSAYNQGITIENALRKVGYGISYIKKRGRIPFAYKIDFVDKEIMRTTYNIGSSTLSRLYNIEGGKATAISSFTTRGFKKRIYQTAPNRVSILSNYINIDDTISNGKKAIVTIKALNVRDRPSSKGKILGKYYKNSVVYVETPIVNKKREKWSRVVEDNGILKNIQNRYIASRYIKYIE